MNTRGVMRFVSRIIVGILVAVFVGGWIDKMLHTKPFFMLVLILYVIIGGLYQLVKEASD